MEGIAEIKWKMPCLGQEGYDEGSLAILKETLINTIQVSPNKYFPALSSLSLINGFLPLTFVNHPWLGKQFVECQFVAVQSLISLCLTTLCTVCVKHIT